MNKHLQELIQVASFDKQIDDLAPKIQKVREKLDEKIRLKEQVLKNIESLNQEAHAIDLEITQHDRNIQEASLKLENISKKQKEIKTEKEMRALDVESDIAKENMTNSNSEIQRLEALKASKQEEKEACLPKLAEIEEHIRTLEEETKSEVQEIKKVQQEIFQKKEALVANMDSKITGFYAKIRRWAGNTSVVPVFKQACGGCFIKINDMVYNEILKGQEILNCPHCGRILYAKKDGDTQSDEKPKNESSKRKAKA